MSNLKIIFFITILILQNINANEQIKNKKIYPMGERIFKSQCSEIDPNIYKTIEQLKSAIVGDKLCKPLKQKYLDALSIYLWDIKRVGSGVKKLTKIEVDHTHKCPVCGMFVYKYPRWATQIDGYYFDGVKDMMKFYFSPKEWGDYKTRNNFKKLLVRDYYSQNTIDATKAYYVIGSDIYGPMGDELIPFENIEDAKTFSIDHRGYKIVKFDEITQEEVYKLDE